MSFKQNGRLIQQLPMRFRGGAILSFDYQETNKSQLRNIFAGSAGIDPRNGTPAGHLAPSSWTFPQKQGGMSSFTGCSSSGYIAGSMSSGRNLISTNTGSGNFSGNMTLVSGSNGAILCSGYVSGNISSKLEMASSISASSSLAGIKNAIGTFSSNINCSSSVSLQSYSLGNMSADITPFLPLSPQSLADAVWESKTSDYTAVGTMGEKVISNSGATPQEIWDFDGTPAPNSIGETVQITRTAAKNAFVGTLK